MIKERTEGKKLRGRLRIELINDVIENSLCESEEEG